MHTPHLESGSTFSFFSPVSRVPPPLKTRVLTFDGIPYPTFREACIACGLLENDQERHHCVGEAKCMQTGFQLQHLFVTILHECTPARPRELWDKFWHDICDDLKHQLQRR